MGDWDEYWHSVEATGSGGTLGKRHGAKLEYARLGRHGKHRLGVDKGGVLRGRGPWNVVVRIAVQCKLADQ